MMPPTLSLSLLPVTCDELRAEMARLRRELVEDVGTALKESQASQAVAMQDALKSGFAELNTKAKPFRQWAEADDPIPSRSRPTPPGSPDLTKAQPAGGRRRGSVMGNKLPQGGGLYQLKSAAAKIEVDDFYDTKQKDAKEARRKSMRVSYRGGAGVPESNGERGKRGSIMGLWMGYHGGSNIEKSIETVLRDAAQVDGEASVNGHAPGKAWMEETTVEVIDINPSDDGAFSSSENGSRDADGRLDVCATDTEGQKAAKKFRKMGTKHGLDATFEDSVEDDGQWGIHSIASGIVKSGRFEVFIAVVVLSNTMYIGLQTELHARMGMDKALLTIDRSVDSGFCTIFVLEILMRLYVYRWNFIRRPDVGWNMFDCGVVLIQLLELLIAWFSEESLPKNFSMLRILRILRAIRIIRLVRMLRPLRVLVMSILGSLQPLFWTVTLLFFVIYLMGVFLTQSVADFLVDADVGQVPAQDLLALKRYYGTLFLTMLALFQAVSGGVDWEDMINPLMTHISPFIGMLLALYIAFSQLALMNVVSGYFVQSALENSKREHESYMLSLVRQVLRKLDVDSDGLITWDEFAGALEMKEMQEYFKTVDVDISDAESLWNLLDVDGVGSIDGESLLNGCLQLQGSASALGQKLVIREMARVFQSHSEMTTSLVERFNDIETLLQVRPGTRPRSGRPVSRPVLERAMSRQRQHTPQVLHLDRLDSYNFHESQKGVSKYPMRFEVEEYVDV